MCTYCIVPFTRGRERSRPIDSILEEVRMLSDQVYYSITLLLCSYNLYVSNSLGIWIVCCLYLKIEFSPCDRGRNGFAYFITIDDKL